MFEFEFVDAKCLTNFVNILQPYLVCISFYNSCILKIGKPAGETPLPHKRDVSSNLMVLI